MQADHSPPPSGGILFPLRLEPTEGQVGVTLTFVAGAINAGGFMVVGQYTSHMSGIASAVADHLVIGAMSLVLAGLVALVTFGIGAACSAILINWGRRHRRRSQYTLPLFLEMLLLLCFGIAGALLQDRLSVEFLIVPLLCFLMGLQNALITKVSGARIRTTHVTGIVTDLGIELGKLVYWNRHKRDPDGPHVRADRSKLRLLSAMLAGFLIGGIVGAWSFGYFGLAACLPLAAILLLLSNAMVRASN